MKSILRHIVHRTYRPILQWYLSSPRTYKYEDIELEVWPGIFHPGFFHSTTYLLEHILKNEPLKGHRLLELGCGSGLISIIAASKGAEVIATDIHPKAVQNTNYNAQRNNMPIRVVQSDLFTEIQDIPFDIIAINPPYYRGKAAKNEDHAWYCGESMEYFQRLFDGLPVYIEKGAKVYMVLSDGCELDAIKAMADEKHVLVNFIDEKRLLLERNFIFSIQLKGK